MSASGFPGNRVEAMRAGMMIKGFIPALKPLRLFAARCFGSIAEFRLANGQYFYSKAPLSTRLTLGPDIMDELGFNKIAAAVLATALGFMLIKEVSHSAMHVSKPEKPAYALEIPEVGGGDVAEIDLPFPQPEWIAGMDVERGAKVFKKCTSCHNADDGGNNGTGPNLWNIVGAPAAQKDGFGYSAALTNSGIVWDYEALDGFIKKPGKYLSGTAMNFVGVKKDTDRAAVIAYLRAASNAPIPMPIPAASPADEMVEDIAQDITDTGETVVENATDIVDDVVEGAGDLVEDAGEVLEDAGEAVADTAEDVVDGAKDLLEKAKDAVSDDQ